MPSIEPTWTLDLRGVRKSFGGIVAADDVSLRFDAGCIAAIVGPNGAGKTTLMNIMSGFAKPDRGEVFLADRCISTLAPHRIARLGVGRLFQEPRVLENMSLVDNVAVASGGSLGESIMRGLLTLRAANRDERATRGRAADLLQFVGLYDKKDCWGEQLSYGEKKLLSIARLLAMESRVLLLDEPSSGVSPALVGVLGDIFRRIAGRGCAVVVVEHNLRFVTDLVDVVHVMSHGRVLCSGPPVGVLNSQTVMAAYGGA